MCYLLWMYILMISSELLEIWQYHYSNNYSYVKYPLHVLLMILRLNIMIVHPSETAFQSIVESGKWSFSRSYSFSVSIFTMTEHFLFYLVENSLLCIFILPSRVYICPGPNNFCFFKLKSTIPWSELNPWTLCTIDSHARATWNWVLLIDGDVEPFSILFHFSQSLPNSVACWNGLQLFPLNQLVDRKT